MIQFDLIHKIIDQYDSFLITTHVNPDGDAIGCEIALSIYLQRLGKKVSIYNYNETPSNLTFLDNNNVIRVYNQEKDISIFTDHDVLVAVDFNQLNRIGTMEEGFRNSNRTKICIDHHDKPEPFTENMFVDISYGSTGEIIFDLIDSAKQAIIDHDLALPLYAAIMTDSGSFKYERTTPATHIKAARLLEAGVDPKHTYRELFDNGSVGRIRLLGRALDSIKLFHDGQLCTMVIRNKDLEDTHTIIADMEGFINYTLTISGVKIGLFLYELENGFKVSFRSVGNIPVNKLAAEFKGGGHFHAAGARIENFSIDDKFSEIINSAKKYLIK